MSALSVRKDSMGLLASLLVAAATVACSPAARPADVSTLKGLSQRDMLDRFSDKAKVYNGYRETDGKIVRLKEQAFFSVSLRGIRFMAGDTYASKENSSWYGKDEKFASTGMVIVGNILYRLGRFEGVADEEFVLTGIFAANNDSGVITSLSAEEHKQRVVAYFAGRREAIAERKVKDSREASEKIDAAIAARTAELNRPLSPEEEARLERALGLDSFSVIANASGPKGKVQLTVVAKLEDGSTMRIHRGERIFKELFKTNVNRLEKVMLVEVKMKDDEEMRFFKELPYSFDNPQTIRCNGGKGADGMETDSIGAMFYNGQRGADAASVTVKISTSSSHLKTDDGGQILHYEISCGGVNESFDAGPDSKIQIYAIGGKGGYGIPRANGDGTNGGAGGAGGDLTVTVDPAVAKYTLEYDNRGGQGGNASDPSRTNQNKQGRAGSQGNKGRHSVVRANAN